MFSRLSSFKLIFPFILLFLALLFPYFSAAQENNQILILTLDGTVNPISARYISEEISAAQEGFSLILIEINTPGGGDRSMREIIQSILLSRVPVAVYVYPPGARAASAGTFIAYGAHIAAMAPGTNIGAAHPVTIGEQPEQTTMEKITNDAVSFIVSLAEKNGRNKEWAEKAVRESASISAEQALADHVVDILAQDRSDLLRQLEGRVVQVNGNKVLLQLEGATQIYNPPSLWNRFLQAITDPNIAYILLIIGIYAIIAEVFHPTIVAGVIGAISLLLAFLAFESLSINLVGLLLILVSVVLFILEIKTPGFGILGTGGIISFVLGSLMLFGPQGFYPTLTSGLSLWLVGTFAALSIIFFFIVIAAAIRARSRPNVKLELDSLMGQQGIASTDIKPTGMVLVAGSYWRARSISGEIKKEEEVKIVGQEGFELLVERREKEWKE